MIEKLRIIIFLIVYSVIKDIEAKSPLKIIGGVAATIEEFPSLVSIRVIGEHYCGGTLITNKHVLTTAHCVVFDSDHASVYEMVLPPEMITLYAGSDSRRSSKNPLEVEEVHVHENYTGDYKTDYHDDIAILTFKNAIEPGPTMRPIALASKNSEPGEIGYIAGWGYVTPRGPGSLRLRKALTKIQDNYNCWEIPDTQLCGVISHGIGFCNGDSGGPLIINNEIVGIASNSDGCARGFPDVFTRVFSYRDWIHNIINE